MDIESALKIVKRKKGKHVSFSGAQIVDDGVIVRFIGDDPPILITNAHIIREGFKIWAEIAAGNCDYAEGFFDPRKYLGPRAGPCDGHKNVTGGTAIYCVSDLESDEMHMHLCERHTRMLVGDDGIAEFRDINEQR